MYSKWAFLIVINIVQFTQLCAQTFQVSFGQKQLEIHMNTDEIVNLTISNIHVLQEKYKFRVKCDKEELAVVNKIIDSAEINKATQSWDGNFEIHAKFLGNARVYVELEVNNEIIKDLTKTELELIIIRESRVIDHVFTGCVALLVSLLYINFGAALDLGTMKEIVRRPIGPAIGFGSQFVLMPVVSFILGYIIFPNSMELQLGMFFTGVSPAGGASNIWTVILQGNINLSIAMTAIGNIAAFGMMPLWIFTLGRVIFERGNLGVPYGNIATFAVSLVVPLAIGIAIQRFLPRVARLLVRLLKPVSILLILFIIIFAIVTNLYLFDLFSWQIVVAGLALPCLGYTLGWILAKILRQSAADALTIAIETGIQNTGIAIFLLRFSLPQPQADLTTVIPVCVAIMTPIPLFILYLILKIRNRGRGDSETIHLI